MGLGRILIILLVLVGVVGGVHTYLWWRLVAGPFRSRRARLIGAAVIAGLFVSALIGMRAAEKLPEPFSTFFGWVGPLWVATMFYLLLFLLVSEPIRAVARTVLARRRRRVAVTASVTTNDEKPDQDAGTPAEQPPTDPDRPASDVDRRQFLARATALVPVQYNLQARVRLVPPSEMFKTSGRRPSLASAATSAFCCAGRFRLCSSVSHWKCSRSSAASTERAEARFLGEWNWAQSRASEKCNSAVMRS